MPNPRPTGELRDSPSGPLFPTGGDRNSVILFGAQSSQTTQNARWLFPGYAQSNPQNTDTIRMIVPRPGTLRRLYIRHNVPGSVAISLIYTVQKNGLDTALVVNLLANETDGNNTAIAVAMAAGDELGLKLVKAAKLTGGAVLRIVASLELG